MSTSKVFLNYTDFHDVDEDMATIVRHGGWYVDGNLSGITCRFMRETPTNTSESVASSNMKNSQIIRMVLMSTKTWCLLASAMGNGTMESI